MPSFSWAHESGDGTNRLDYTVAAKVGKLSRVAAQRLIREGAVSVDGRVVTRPSYALSSGQTVEVELPSPAPDAVPPVEADISVVFEDGDIVVVDKTPGISVHPGNGHINDTLVNHLLARYPMMASIGERDRPGVVHRLDRDTSGLLVFALSQPAYEALVAALKKRSISRMYVALVYGHPPQDEALIDAPIGRDPGNRTRQAVVSSGKEARTRYRVVRRIGQWSLLELTLDTGRMHQIRVHLAAAGYPVAGDPTYGDAPRIAGLKRQFLHASRLVLKHPSTGEEREFECPLPDDLQSTLTRLEHAD